MVGAGLFCPCFFVVVEQEEMKLHVISQMEMGLSAVYFE
jgi:hypothetical protein